MPTKELYSMAGLILIMKFMDWTKDEALDAYSFNMNVQYALNLEPVAHNISTRTLERYINLFKEDDLAKATMDKIAVIEGTNSGLKRKTGLGQLRVRGKPAVFHAIYFKYSRREHFENIGMHEDASNRMEKGQNNHILG